MEENFVGYLLDALDGDERRQVETYLRARPEARKRLNHLRQCLQPLAADLDPIEPAPGLWVRTLARVAEHQCRHLPAAPDAVAFRRPPPARGWWRRADVLVAAGVLLCVSLLIPSALNLLHHRHNIAACQDNLRVFYVALKGYSDHHDGSFPDVAAAAPPPRNVAGLVVPILQEGGFLGDNARVSCPAQGRRPPCHVSLADVRSMDLDDFEELAPALTCCYAYSLGYWDEAGRLRGLRFDPSGPCSGHLPIMADRPPANVGAGDLVSNSPNHDGKGQNVLFTDGHCQYLTTRMVAGDDIYLNTQRKVAPGTHACDAVLGSSATHP